MQMLKLGVCGFALVLMSMLMFPISSVRGDDAPSQSLTKETVANTAVYFFVLDHSTSMNTLVKKGQTRWEQRREEAVIDIKRIPLGCEVRFYIFSKVGNIIIESFVLKDENERQKAINFIAQSSAPVRSNDNGTCLYDVQGLALEAAHRLSQDIPNRYIVVMIYTDGIDEKSVRETEATINQKYGKYQKDNPNLFLIRTDVTKEKEKKVLQFPLEIILENPVVSPIQVVPLKIENCCQEMNGWLNGTSFSFRFESDDPQSPIKLNKPIADVKFSHGGGLSVKLDIANSVALDITKEYHGKLFVAGPETATHKFESTPQSIKIRFIKKDSPPNIRCPANNSVVITNVPVLFFVDTRPGAMVRWDFGDGSNAEGPECRHPYTTPGFRDVVARVQSDPKAEPAIAKIRLEVIDVGITIDPFANRYYKNCPATLRCTARGEIDDYEWVVGGAVYNGASRKDGINGSEISFPDFSAAGKILVTVKGRSVKANTDLYSKEIALTVINPVVTLIAPKDTTDKVYGQEIDFAVAVTGADGLFDKVVWKATKEDGSVLVQDIESPLAPAADGRQIARFTHKFEERETAGKVTVVARASVPIGWTGQVPATAPFTFQLVPPGRGIKITNDNTEKEYGNITFNAVTTGFTGTFDKVKWTIKETWMTDNGTEERPETQLETSVEKEATSLTHIFKEDPNNRKNVSVTVTAESISRPGWTGPSYKAVPLTFRLISQSRSVTVLVPGKDAVVYLNDDPTVFVTAISGKEISSVYWRMIDEEGKLFLDNEQNVAADATRAEWNNLRFTAEKAGGPRKLSVTATLKPWGIESSPVSFNLAFRSPGVPWVTTGDGKSIQDYGKPMPFKLGIAEKSPKVLSIDWDFGDGATIVGGTDANQVHGYKAVGDFTVKANVRFQGKDEKIPATPMTVKIVADPVEAKPNLGLAGKKIEQGSTIELRDDSKGTIATRIWKLNNVELPTGTRSVVADKLGPQTLELIVMGPTDYQTGKPVSNDPAEIRFDVVRAQQRLLFWIIFSVVFLLAMLAIEMLRRRYSGNEPLSWEVAYARGDQDLEFAVFTPVKLEGLARSWNFHTKSAVFPLSEIIPPEVIPYPDYGPKWGMVNFRLFQGIGSGYGYYGIALAPDSEDFTFHKAATCLVLEPQPYNQSKDEYAGGRIYFQVNDSGSCDLYRWRWYCLTVLILLLSGFVCAVAYLYCFNVFSC
jgi:hypothetical protein